MTTAFVTYNNLMPFLATFFKHNWHHLKYRVHLALYIDENRWKLWTTESLLNPYERWTASTYFLLMFHFSFPLILLDDNLFLINVNR